MCTFEKYKQKYKFAYNFIDLNLKKTNNEFRPIDFEVFNNKVMEN